MKLKHIDLFSGIGGFALAVDTVWPGSEHIFCDFDPFCQKVLNKHWPNSKIYGDIRTITNARGKKQRGLPNSARQEVPAPWIGCDILTGGFPCQPFSAAGKRKGTEDDRHLWPEMFRVIQTFKPAWVIAENVRGLLTWSDGLVFEQVCADLEGQGYEVQPLIIPAVAVNAPHRRDRIWFIAHASEPRAKRERGEIGNQRRGTGTDRTPGIRQTHGKIGTSGATTANPDVANPAGDRWGGQGQAIAAQKGYAEQAGQLAGRSKGSHSDASDAKEPGLERADAERNISTGRWDSKYSWNTSWLEVATELCGVDDGLPAELDGLKLTKAGHRAARLKALGNAIVPQVAIEIMKAIKQTYEV